MAHRDTHEGRRAGGIREQRLADFLATRFSQPDIFGSAGGFGTFVTGGGSDTRDQETFGSSTAIIDGREHTRIGQSGQEALRPYVQNPDEMFYDPKFGWVVTPEVVARIPKRKDRFFDKYGPALASFGLMAGPMAAASAASTAGAGAGGTVAGGSAPFIAAEGAGGLAALGETALPALGAAGGATLAGAGGAGMTAAQQAALLSAEGPVSASTGLGGSGPLTAESVTGSTALSRLLGLGQTGSDVLSILSSIAPGILGYLGAGQQSGAYSNVANQYLGIGAPFRQTLEGSYQPGFDLSAQPGYGDAFNRIADISARQYGATFGNPAGSPTAQGGILSDVWNQGYLPALANYRSQLGTFGGLGIGTSGAASLGGAQVAGGGLDAIGLGLSRAMTPANPYEAFFRNMTNQFKTVY